MRSLFVLALVLLATSAPAAEQMLDFGTCPLNQTPAGFKSTVAGEGNPGDWKVVLKDVPPVLRPLTSEAPSVTRRPVLAQLAREATSHHYPMLIYQGGNYGDFKLTTRFKIAGGGLEEVAGVVFHYQNQSNFYAVGADALNGTFRCFKVANGQWKPPLGPALKISRDKWYDLSVRCEGNRIVCSLDGNDAIKLIDSSDNRPGKIGFWTKADTVSYFLDTKVIYTPQENPAQRLVRQALKEYSRLLGLKIYAALPGASAPSVIASKDKQGIGKPGGQIEADVIRSGNTYVSKNRHSVLVTLPLCNRNGVPIAAVGVLMKTFPGQTEANAIVRAKPVVRQMQKQVLSREDLLP